ncbi:MAG TPA: hypothetical protein VIH90_01410 [Candidatus Saccharimonadales bacterium]
METQTLEPITAEPILNDTAMSQIESIGLAETFDIPPQTQVEEAGAEDVAELSLKQKFMKSVAARAITEVAGVGIDAMLMGAGSAGVGLMANVGARESFASAADLAILNKLSPNEKTNSHDLPKSRLRRIGHFAAVMATAIAAQKVGPGIMEHIPGNFNHGLGHFAVPLTSKVGATTWLNRILSRHL